MASPVHFRALEEGDIAFLAARLRSDDRRELQAVWGAGVDFASILAHAVRLSTHLWVMEAAGEPIALFGVAPISLLQGVGAPWLLGTDAVKKQARTLVVKGRWYVALMDKEYPGGLCNFVDARNTLSVRWLRSLGFTLHPPAPYGGRGAPFHKFELKRAC